MATPFVLFDRVMNNWSGFISAKLTNNLNGPFLCTQPCAPVMLRNANGGGGGSGGSVVNIASISELGASTVRVVPASVADRRSQPPLSWATPPSIAKHASKFDAELCRNSPVAPIILSRSKLTHPSDQAVKTSGDRK